MIGNLLTLITAIGAFGLAAVAFQQVLARRTRVLVRATRSTPDISRDDRG